MTENIDHRRWSERCLLTRGDHIKKWFFKIPLLNWSKTTLIQIKRLYSEIRSLSTCVNAVFLIFRIALWFVSNCDTFSAREDYVTELIKYLNVSMYGNCNGQPLKNPLDVGWDFTFNMMSKWIWTSLNMWI